MMDRIEEVVWEGLAEEVTLQLKSKEWGGGERKTSSPARGNSQHKIPRPAKGSVADVTSRRVLAI